MDDNNNDKAEAVEQPTMTTSETDVNASEEPENATTTTSRKPLCAPWTAVTQCFHGLIKRGVLKCSLHAAKYPELYCGTLTLLAISLVVIGFFTNFQLELDIEAILSPTGSQPALVSTVLYNNYSTNWQRVGFAMQVL